MGKVERRAEQGDVRQGLREISGQTFLLRIVLLRQEAQVVARAQQPLEEDLRLLMSSEPQIGVRQPKTASPVLDPKPDIEMNGVPPSAQRACAYRERTASQRVR